MPTKENIDKAVCHQLAALLDEYGVLDVVVCPGSRNAPIIVALERSEAFDLHYVVDERSAAFTALGLALGTGRAVALTCTSGTAMLNFGPALAEAYYSRVPLIAITADRPQMWIDQRDSQTIRQGAVLQGILRKSVDLAPDNDSEKTLTYHNRLINSALQAATGLIPGPVQINVQLDTPLTPMAPMPTKALTRTIYNICPRVDIESLAHMLEHAGMADRNILIVAGGFARVADIKPAMRSLLLHNSRVALLAEMQSNMSELSCVSAGKFEEALANDKIDAAFEPDFVVTMGGALVSARIKTWLRGLQKARFISVGYDDDIVDTFNRLEATIQCAPTDFINALDRLIATKPDQRPYSSLFRPLISMPSQSEAFFQNLAVSLVDRRACLNISNGSAIRRAQYMMLPHTTVWCNRGVSGIDGSTSTAIGFARSDDARPTVLLTGDMSAAYDISALSARPLPRNFKMIVLDNKGGDIFRRIKPTSSLPECEKYLCAMPAFPLEKIAEAYGLAYETTHIDQASTDTLNSFLDIDGPAILHVEDIVTSKPSSKH